MFQVFFNTAQSADLPDIWQPVSAPFDTRIEAVGHRSDMLAFPNSPSASFFRVAELYDHVVVRKEEEKARDSFIDETDRQAQIQARKDARKAERVAARAESRSESNG